jgi:hypothetical protein
MHRQFSNLTGVMNNRKPEVLASRMNDHLAEWTSGGWNLEAVTSTHLGGVDGMVSYSFFWRKDD